MVWTIYFNRFFLSLTVFLALFQSPVNAQAKVLFEGYSKILVAGVHAGYVIQRYELDEKNKQFVSTYYIRGNNSGRQFVESLKARSTTSFKPVSYQYTSQVDNQIKAIDAKFAGNQMSAVIDDGKLKNNVQKELPNGTFLSTFQAYLMLKNGVSPGKKYDFSAVAEESAEVQKGEALIEKEQAYMGQSTYKILNSFAGQKFVSFMTPRGHVLATESPAQQVATQLVASRNEAVAKFPFSEKNIKTLFGNLPSGQVHALAENKQSGDRKGASIKSKPEKSK